MDDWLADIEPADYARQTARRISAAAQPAAEIIGALAERLRAAKNPALVAGPDIDASGGWDDAVTLAESQHMAVWATPPTGGGRLGFPEDHPAFQGVLLPAVGPIGEQLKPYDLVIVAGSSVFPYYPNIPGPHLAEGTELVQLTADDDEAARAIVGDAIVGDVALTLRALLAELDPDTAREAPPVRPGPVTPDASEPMTAAAAGAVLAAQFPRDGILVLEAPTAVTALRDQLRISQPGSYYFAAGNGLGYGLAASVGVQLAQPDRPTICVLGEGSAQYAITAFWTAAAYSVPVKFLVLNNSEYSILKWFASLENVTGSPGLDLPRLDVAATAASYGVPSVSVQGADALGGALESALAQDGPSLVQVTIAPGMAIS